MYGVRQAIKDEEERVRGAQRKAASERKAPGDKISRQKDIQDLYARESKKRGAMNRVAGSRGLYGSKESPEYKKRMAKLKAMAEGRKIPLEMRDIFGS
tara:strand:+ start:216 stop:509 length:294 start_codon:yes stop_codon:yes gene_type:complete